MKPQSHTKLGSRERQIMEVVYRLGRATVAEVLAQIEDPPSYSAVRAMLRILEDKGHLKHIQDGPRYLYLPVVSGERARRSILQDVVKRLFDNSTEKAVAALLESSSDRMSDAELERLQRLIDSSRRKGR
ncbi:MAG TPA: BlaI/MecI/CopY family transcriptional regulator [Methylomirabilota bacterium]|nr:BlaI/MecI/CopY family transcriptional regulator [Methylomirabilota bacterium]